MRDGSLESLGEAEQLLLEQLQQEGVEEIPGEFLEPMSLRFQAAAEQESVRRRHLEYLVAKYAFLERVYRLAHRLIIWRRLPDCIVTLKEICEQMEQESRTFLTKEGASQEVTTCKELLQHALAHGKPASRQVTVHFMATFFS